MDEFNSSKHRRTDFKKPIRHLNVHGLPQIAERGLLSTQ
jgi:hypothetical protein